MTVNLFTPVYTIPTYLSLTIGSIGVCLLLFLTWFGLNEARLSRAELVDHAKRIYNKGDKPFAFMEGVYVQQVLGMALYKRLLCFVSMFLLVLCAVAGLCGWLIGVSVYSGFSYIRGKANRYGCL